MDDISLVTSINGFIWRGFGERKDFRIFRRTYRREEKGEIAKQMYEYESYLREMGLKAELLFVGMIAQPKGGGYPKCGCYAIFRIPGTNRCIVALLHCDG